MIYRLKCDTSYVYIFDVQIESLRVFEYLKAVKSLTFTDSISKIPKLHPLKFDLELTLPTPSIFFDDVH